MEDQLFRRPAAGKRGDLVLQLLLAHQVVVALLHLHGVAQGAGGPGHDGDLLYRGGIGLLGRDQSVADLVVGHHLLLLVCQDGVLLLVACDDHLDALFQICLGSKAAAVPDSPQRRLVDDVGQLCAAGAGCHSGHLAPIHVLRHLDLLGVDLQNILPAL